MSTSATTTEAAVERPQGHRRPPQLNRSIPFLGHMLQFGRGPLDMLAHARDLHGDVVGFKLVGKQFYFMSGVDANEALFRATDDMVSFREPYALTVPVFGKGVVYDAEPPVMAEQLGFLMNSLRDKRMRTYADQIADEVTEYVANWGDAGTIDLLDMTKELTTYTSSRCLLGREFREEMTVEFAQVYHDIEAGFTPVAYLNPYLPLPSFRKRDKARVRMEEMITEVVANRRKKNVEGNDFLQVLMEAKYEDGTPLTESEITGLLLAVIFAGHHTSSVTAAWTLLRLLQNPRYLPPILEELEGVYGDGQPVTYTSLRELPKLENAIKEASRLNPALVMLMRKLVKPLYFRDFVLEKDSWLVASPYVSHRIPEVFPEPLKFDPDRFDSDREEDKVPYAFITFGGGKHRCMGMHFALMQIKSIYATLLRQYEFELMGDAYEPDFKRMVHGPLQPCRVRYRRRKSA